jgi:hypothetical protein
VTEIKDWPTRVYDPDYFVPIQKADRVTGKFPLSGLVGLGTWQLRTTDFAAVAGGRYRINASAGDVVVGLPVGNIADLDIEIQRLDSSINKVLVRTSEKINGQTGVDGVFAPSNPQQVERLSFTGTILGWLGQFDKLTYQAAPPTTGTNLTYVSDGDANGLFYWLGTAQGTTAWSNPAGGSLLSALASTQLKGTVSELSDRLDSDFYTDQLPDQWVAWALGGGVTMSVTKYTYRARNFDTNHLPRNWVLEGTNTVSAFDVAGVNAATWTAIDTRSNDATIINGNQYYTLTVNGSTSAYSYLRFRQSGPNSTSGLYFTFGELEFYGVAY